MILPHVPLAPASLSAPPPPRLSWRGAVAVLALIGLATLIGLAIAARWGTSSVVLLYVPPVLEALGLAEVEKQPRNNRMRAI